MRTLMNLYSHLKYSKKVLDTKSQKGSYKLSPFITSLVHSYDFFKYIKIVNTFSEILNHSAFIFLIKFTHC